MRVRATDLFFRVTAMVIVMMLVAVRHHLVMFLSGRTHRVHVNGGIGQVLQAVQEPLMS